MKALKKKNQTCYFYWIYVEHQNATKLGYNAWILNIDTTLISNIISLVNQFYNYFELFIIVSLNYKLRHKFHTHTHKMKKM